MLRIIFIFLGLSLVTSAQAQMLAGKVVADCTVGNPTTVAVGSSIPLAVDINGKLCTNATGGGGSTVSISQATPGTTNGVYITGGGVSGYATGAAFSGSNGVVTGGVDGSGNFLPNHTAAPMVKTDTPAFFKVLKASAGHIVDASASCTVAGYLFVVDAAANPADGTVVPLLPPVALPANGSASLSFDNGAVPLTSGAVAFVSTTFVSAGAFTKTTPGSGSCWIGGRVF